MSYRLTIECFAPGQGPCTFEVTVRDCVRGLRRAVDTPGCFEWARFDVAEYEFYEKVGPCHPAARISGPESTPPPLPQ